MKPKTLFASLLHCAFALSSSGQTGNNPGIPIFGGPPQTQIAQNYTGTANPNGVVTAGVGSLYLQQSNIWWFEFVNTNSTISGWSLVLSTTNGQLFAVGTNATLLNGIGGSNYAQLTIPSTPTNNGVIDTNSLVQLQKMAPNFFAGANPLPLADEEDDYNSLGATTYTSMTNHVTWMITNGLINFGLNLVQVSDAVLTNLSGPNPGPTGGNPDYYPPAFPNGGSNFVAWCHSNGVKVMQYISLNTAGTSSAGNPSFPYPQSIALADKLCTNINVDAVFIEGIGVAQDQWQIPLFLSEFVKFGKPVYVHTPGAFTLPGAAGVISTSSLYQPWDDNWINSHYANIDGGPDPNDGTWTNFITHFKKNIEFSQMTRPGHWVRNYYVYGQSDGAPWQRDVFEAAAAMQGGWIYHYFMGPYACSRMTNTDFLALWRDPLVMSASVAAVNASNAGLTNWLFTKPLFPVGGTNALAFFLCQTNNEPLVLSTTNVGLPGPVLTLYSPWSHAIEGWFTNTFTFSGTNQQSALYKVMQGIVLPPIVEGTNFLNNLKFRLNATNGNALQACVSAASPAGWLPTFCNGNTIQMSNVFYTNGLSVAGPAYADWPIGGMCTNFSTVCGIGDPFAANAAVQFTFYTNGVQAAQTFWITNSSQDTNINLPLYGVNDLAVFVNGTQNVAPDQSWEVGCLGNPVIVNGGTNKTFATVYSGNVFSGTVLGSVVISSNLPPIFPSSSGIDSSFSGDTLDVAESESPFFFVGDIKTSVNGTLGTWQFPVPNWVTNAVCTMTVQWQGNPTGLLSWTNDYNSFYWPTNNAGRTGATGPSSYAVNLHTNLNYVVWTNSWPDTNCVKAIRILSGGYGALTNSTAPVRIIKVNVQASGNGITSTNL